MNISAKAIHKLKRDQGKLGLTFVYNVKDIEHCV